MSWSITTIGPRRNYFYLQQTLMDLLYEAATIHREHHDPNVVQVSTLLSIKTGGCPEDCGYCPQAAEISYGYEGNDLMSQVKLKHKH